MSIALFWFRQDLRLTDNPALADACSRHSLIIPLYIYDEKNSVLGQAQAWWLHHSLAALEHTLNQVGLHLILRRGDPMQIISELITHIAITGVYWNRCYEPQTISRDKAIKHMLQERGVFVRSSCAHVLNEPWTISNKQGDFFKVFTPYWKHCIQHIHPPATLKILHYPQPVHVLSDSLSAWKLLPRINWDAQFAQHWTPGEQGAQQKLDAFITHHLHTYQKNRDIPSQHATSRLSPHLHFGEISPWAVWRAVAFAKLDPHHDVASANRFLSELGWREFSIYLLYHIPHLSQENFRREFDAFPWRHDPQQLARWQKGMTGFPLVDAGMRELWATGYMHNRVRMIVASFLTKDLLMNWRLGAQWFLDTLVDADLANNSISWQWVAGCGVDPAPYFRIFNPVLQSKTFDPNGTYIRRWIPEISHLNSQHIHEPWINKITTSQSSYSQYPMPMIDHHAARHAALNHYKQLKKEE